MKQSIFTNSTIRPFIVALICVLEVPIVLAQEQKVTEPVGARVLETGVLQNTAGFTGAVLGAEVIAITPGADDSQVIDIVVPVNPDEVDRVRVVTPDGKPLKQKQALEISMDHENNEVGVTLRLPRKDRLGFKIRLIDLPDDQ
ncbi:MAG: hypothetical protein JSU67_11080 [Gammaproteobacteria bacterium]|nr:MAG: hypothetical protein EP300_08620 [Gammaproteobacteria bacterium]UCH38708.1 MAG: hypothetical protein JSU67_11080 [Gammaproteobacteria bacterium]